MALDSQIPLQAQAPPNPLEQYGKVLALRNALGQGQVQQQQLQLGQQQIQQGALALKGQQALDAAYKQAYTVDADGNPTLNAKAVTESLSSAGMGHLIPSTIKSFTDMDEAATKLKKAKIETKTAADDYTANGLLAISDSGFNPSIAATVLAHARETGLLPPDQAAQLASQIAANPTSETVRGLIEPILSKSPAYQKLVDSRKTATAAADRAAAATGELEIGKKKLQQETDQKLLNAVAAAGSQQQLDQLREQAKQAGASVGAIQRIPAMFSPAGMQGFQRSLMTQEQRTQADQAAATAKQTAAHQTVEEQQAASRHRLEQSKDTRDQQIYNQTYGEGANTALVGVEPKLRTAATAAAQKAADEFGKAQAAERDMKTFIDAARAGNKEAYAYLSPEGVLTLNTGRGVTRVNRQEIDAYAGAGSLFDRIAGKAGKMMSGKSVSADVLKDIEALHQQINGNSAATYNQKLGSINQNYHASFKPVETVTAPAPAAGGWKVIGVK